MKPAASQAGGSPSRWWRKALATVAFTTTLAGVFLLYWRPEMAFDLATKFWSCF